MASSTRRWRYFADAQVEYDGSPTHHAWHSSLKCSCHPACQCIAWGTAWLEKAADRDDQVDDHHCSRHRSPPRLYSPFDRTPGKEQETEGEEDENEDRKL